MIKIDYKKELKHLYLPSAKEVSLLEVPAMNFLMIDGSGNPNTSEEFQKATEALYGVAYTLKFGLKKKGVGPDFTILPLEGLWWMEGRDDFDTEDKDNWSWTLMIMQPEHITNAQVEEAKEELKVKKNPPALSQIRFENYHEGLSVQILYIGPYSEEGSTIEMLHRYAEEKGYNLHKKHHEIYLGDPRRTKPENLKTVIRQPVIKE
ncbi:MAG: GyrI-like domain-containing protein [Fidelibacterota bacterium]